MINFINSWAEGIIIAVIISTIIEMILPEGTIKKYVRTVIGAYIVFVITSPIITKITGKEIKLSDYKLPETETIKQSAIDTNAYIENTYINTIKKDIIENIGNKGYKVKDINIEIETEEENYGNINKIDLTISKGNMQEGNIEPIEIDISNKPEQKEQIQEDEIQELKEFLRSTYGTENIFVTI